VIVTDKNYYMENRLVDKLDMMIARMSDKRRRDNILIVEGGEGEGKTNMSVQVAYYVANKTGRPFGNENIFFDVGKMVEFAKSNEKQIMIWDEPALDGLSVDWWKETQKNLIKLVMMARKKQHFYIFNFTKFYKFPEYIVVDRCIGMIHCFSKDEIEAGHFTYFKKKQIEYLYQSWRGKKKRDYRKYYNFRGKFGWFLPKIIDEPRYEKEKDKAIMSIGDSSKGLSGRDAKLLLLKYKVATCFKLPVTEISRNIGVSEREISRWRNIPKQYPNIINEGGVRFPACRQDNYG